MYDYIKGIVTNIVSNAIILDNNGIGYLEKFYKLKGKKWKR